MNISFSIIVPVYNRPDEVRELLQSLAAQTVLHGGGCSSSKGSDGDDSNSCGGFEVLIIEDGSTVSCEDICKEYYNKLNLKYFAKPNTGRSNTRNYGMEHASGNYFIFFDSDCVIPPQYIETVRYSLETDYSDCYGAPDNADNSFSDTQKAINYAMTSFFTTGGIRGGKANGFTPRSFNMGFSRKVYETVGGFKNMIAEDIELSFRIKKAGFRTVLCKNAFVYHKRRVSLKKMFRQVRTFGKGRVMLRSIDKGLLKMVHLLPLCFVIAHILLLLAATVFGMVAPLYSLCFIAPVVLYALLLFVDATIRNKSIKTGAMAVAASYVQLMGYGIGTAEEFFFKSALERKQEELYR
jgi:glycosyltransferase involved in cell wall biosynthesis